MNATSISPPAACRRPVAAPGQHLADLPPAPGAPHQVERQRPRPAAFGPDRYLAAAQAIDPGALDLALVEPPHRLVEERPERFEPRRISGAGNAALHKTDARSRMRVVQQSEFFHRSRRRHQLHLDVGLGERRAVAFADLVVGVASGPVAMTIRCGGKLLSITSAAIAIAAAVTAIVIDGQWCRRTSPAGMRRYFSLPRASLENMFPVCPQQGVLPPEALCGPDYG